jgi:prepilin signal peptidase PulO-like enzyme (type II secretory pathway)
MRQSMDLAELRARYEIVRRSEYFPAIMGAVAGGLAGALIAGLIAGSRRSSGRSEHGRESAAARAGTLFGLTAREMVQLVAVVASLARQLRDWREQR